MQFKKISIADRDIISEFFNSESPIISEFTFTNLIIWADYYKTEWAVIEGNMVIRMNPADEDSVFYLYPAGKEDKKKSVERLIEIEGENSNTLIIRRVPEDKVEIVKLTGNETVKLSREHSDYVYRINELANLKGRKNHKKKNLLNKFRRENSYEYRYVNLDDLNDLAEFQDVWCDIKGCSRNISLDAENRGIHKLLGHFIDLNLIAGAIYIDGVIKAYIISEELNKNTIVEHIEKADSSIPGIYTAMIAEYCKNLDGQYEFINREQDLGIPFLRKSKMALNPDHLVEKYDVVF